MVKLMYLNNDSFDAVITDSNGKTLEVDCCISEPIASGLPANIAISFPLSSTEDIRLENPCTLRGSDDSNEIEIDELWYHSLAIDAMRRKHARGSFDVLHAGQLKIKRTRWKSDRVNLIFHLSPVRFFNEFLSGNLVDYLATPQMAAELFRIKTVEFGEIRFIKHWSVHRVEKKGATAEIFSGFAAEVECEEAGALPMDQLAEKFKEVLIPLSILTRQAITLHGWRLEKKDTLETAWFVPLDPNLAPDMGQQPFNELCFPDEFQRHAQALIEKFLSASADVKEAVTLLSVALAPHVERSLPGNFSALFSALEQAIALEKLTTEEKKKLRESDSALLAELSNLKTHVEVGNGLHSVDVAARIEGLMKSVESSGPSFNVRFEKFLAANPALGPYMADLWPLKGTQAVPGLKQIRDSLAHGLRMQYSTQAIAVARWHFARLSERLAFVLLDLDIPNGIRPNSYLLVRDQWFDRQYWERIRAVAKQKT